MVALRIIFFQSKRCGVIWAKLEKTNKEKFPECLKFLLTATGFDSLLSLSQIDNETIRELEGYLNRNRKHFDSLQCCFAEEYRGQATFEFLPGHKSILLGIPQRIVEMNTAQNNKTKRKPAEQTPTKNRKTEAEAKSCLVQNLITFLEKNGVQLPFNPIADSNLRDFCSGSEEAEYVYKCNFSCPFCEKLIPVRFKTFWTSSNVTVHLKKHLA